MKFAWWPHTTNRAVASYRLRCLQIVEELRNRGVDAGIFRPADPPKVLVLSKRYDAESLRTAQTLRARHGTRLVLDLCDNHFYADSSAASWQRRADDLRAAARSVDLVVTSSTALAEVVCAEVGQHVATNVIGDAAEPPFMPTRSAQVLHPIAELRLVRLCQELAQQTAVDRRLVWFGNHGSGYADGGMADLGRIRERLEAAHKDSPTSLTVISNNRRKFEDLTRPWAMPVYYLEWHPLTISRALIQHNVAVIPISQNPFTMCKTNNRVATALLHGLAVAADAIPSYKFLNDCIVLDDWDQGLQRLLADIEYRRACVVRGKQQIQAEWSLQSIASRWLQALTAEAA